MNDVSNESIFEIVSGVRGRGEIIRPQLAGHATLQSGSDYYLVRLMVFPGVTYYLSKNRSSLDTYTLFSKKITVDGEVRLQNPVGSGRTMGDLKTHLEVKVPLLNLTLYMNLFPRN
jgi:hypothetical protein